jgi:hypothetical protein
MRAEFPNTVVGYDGLKVCITPAEILACGAGEGGTDLAFPR